MSLLLLDDDDYYFQIVDDLEDDRQFVLIIYDITDNKRRVKFAKLLDYVKYQNSTMKKTEKYL